MLGELGKGFKTTVLEMLKELTRQNKYRRGLKMEA